MARYTYGDSALAAERLRLVAATFGPASRAFVRAMVTERPSLAVDLGCGPGDSTAMVTRRRARRARSASTHRPSTSRGPGSGGDHPSPSPCTT